MGSFVRFLQSRLLPAGLLAGTIIGAGMFSLPYVMSVTGLALGFFYLVAATLAMAILHLMYADLVVRTPGEHRFVGFARLYWGKGAFWAAIAMTVVQMLFVMTIYLILSQSFFKLVAGSVFGSLGFALFWLLGSTAIFLKIRGVAVLQLLITGGIIAIVVVVFGAGVGRISPQWFAAAPSPMLFFLPLAPLLFSMSGRVAIPSIVDYFRMGTRRVSRRPLRQAVTLGTILPAVVYSLFILGVIGLSPIVSEDAISGLGGVSAEVFLVVGILGLISLWSSYFMVGLDVLNVLRYDLRWPSFAAFAVVLIAPLTLYVAGLQSFFLLINFTGGVFLSLEGIFILVMWHKANRMGRSQPLLLSRPSWVTIMLLLGILGAALCAQFVV